MAEYFFKPPEPDWRAPRSNNVTGMSVNKNNEFKVPRIPSRYATQTLCSNAPSNQILESSAFDYMKKSMADRFDLYKKLNLVPVDEVQQISTECLQKLDKLLADSLTQCILPASNPAPSVMNDNGSVFHTIISHASAHRAPAPAPPPPPLAAKLQPVAEKTRRPLKVIPSDDENESIISFFKKNQSSTRTKNTKIVDSIPKPKNNSRTNRVAQKRKDENDTAAEPKKRSDSRTNRVAQKREDENDSPAEPKKRSYSRTNRVAQKLEDENDSPMEPKKRSDSRTNRVAKKRKDEFDSPVEAKKKRYTKRPSKQNKNLNITKNSLRNNNNSKIGYEQTDHELFGDVSSIVEGSLFQFSPNNVLKNMTKVSSNKNDVELHLFSPFANPRSMSGVSAISTPLSKTLSKKALNNRLKKPDVVAELKGAKSRPAAKPIAKNYVLKLDASQDGETSDFSDLDENTDSV